MEGTALERDLARLLKHYAALSPSSPTLIPTPPFPSPRDLSTPAAQQWIVDHVLALNQTRQDGARAWKKAFWSRVVKGIEVGFGQRRAEGDEAVEDEETHPDLLETMVDYLSSPAAASAGAAPGVSRRLYYYGAVDGPIDSWSSIITREEGRLISGGTTGLRTWQACVALSNHLLADPTLVLKHNRIVELGAGVGLLSLVSAKLLAGDAAPKTEGAEPKIVATDVDEKVLEMLQANIAENEMQARVDACALDWELAPDPERDADASELDQWASRVWGADSPRASLVLGADIVYDPTLVGPLSNTLAWLLGSARTAAADPCCNPEALIAGTVRNEETWQLFLSACRTRRMQVEPVKMQRPLPEGSGIVGAEGWEGEGEVQLVRITRAV